MGNFIRGINFFICLLFIIAYSYQVIFMIISLIRKPVKYRKVAQTNRYAFMICARNEDVVIANLIESIKEQSYPAELIDIYVCADNCTDNTALYARQAGAVVFERFNKKKIGKGYALDFLFQKVYEMCPEDYYDGFFVFDADNLLDKRYVAEMNKAFCAGNEVVTSYRNSKNYDTNWITAGYGLWFLRDAKHLNNVRVMLGASCVVTGTGFLVSSKIIREYGGWKFYLLTEDIEFTIKSVLRDKRIGYCHAAKFYDEQPTTLKDSWKQRTRWARGYLQVFRKYRKDLIKGLFGTNGFACFDMTMSIMPAIILSTFSVFINLIMMIISAIVDPSSLMTIIWSCLETCRNSLLLLFAVSFITTLTEWKELRCSTGKKFLYAFTTPLFMATYIPIAISSIFRRVKWDHIKHEDTKSISDINKRKRKKNNIRR
ncbi:MAG: glycosyltransferase [Ruminococcaceae bacterium]|nr:glycosyltransferase [Oscillospiraceae bacterium]